MKKYIPYILAGLIVVAVILLLAGGGGKKEPRRPDERITLRKRDKIPYGSFAAYEGLRSLFPRASVVTSAQEPGYWDSLSVYETKQAVIILCADFSADKYEMKNLIRFIESGNSVFISALNLSYEVTQLLNCEVNSDEAIVSLFSGEESPDSLTVSLANPPFPVPLSYTYPGVQYDGYFARVDTTTTTVLGYNKTGKPDFIHLKAGEGHLYVHLAPMAFTNYFLLHKGNFSYYEKAFSLIAPDTRKIIWDEYYVNHKAKKQQKNHSNWFINFMGYPALRAALLTALLALLVYVLMEMRRKQRYIPVIKKPGNDSLDFVKTIGRLYHDKGDHANLCRKMAAYFLEHVRHRYKLPTAELSDEFIKKLHFKTGVDETEIAGIVYFIRELGHTAVVSDKQLIAFHKQLESFYKKA